MKQFVNLLRYEIHGLFLAPATYIAGILFLILMGLLYLVVLEGVSHSPHEDLPSTQFFRAFWIPTFFIVPLLTMKSLAEERRLGTLETLMSTPISSLAVVYSKFLSAYFFYILIWAITLAFPILIKMVIPGIGFFGNLTDKASTIGGYSFIALSGLLYVALGIFASSLTRSQLVAGMLTFSLLFFVIVGGKLLEEVPFLDVSWMNWFKMQIEYFQTFNQLEDFSRGIIDSRPFFFYISTTLTTLGITTLIIESKV